MPASVSVGAGQDDVFEPKQAPDFASQHCTPPGTAGQLVWQSESVLQDEVHFFSAGGGVGAFDGGIVAAGAGSVVSTAAVGTSALLAQAAGESATARIAVTANAEFEKVAYCTGGL